MTLRKRWHVNPRWHHCHDRAFRAVYGSAFPKRRVRPRPRAYEPSRHAAVLPRTTRTVALLRPPSDACPGHARGTGATPATEAPRRSPARHRRRSPLRRQGCPVSSGAGGCRATRRWPWRRRRSPAHPRRRTEGPAVAGVPAGEASPSGPGSQGREPAPTGGIRPAGRGEAQGVEKSAHGHHPPPHQGQPQPLCEALRVKPGSVFGVVEVHRGARPRAVRGDLRMHDEHGVRADGLLEPATSRCSSSLIFRGRAGGGAASSPRRRDPG